MTTPVVLDWRRHKVGLRRGNCRICGRPAWMRDENNRCCHKVCVEQAIERTAAAVAARTTTQPRRDPRAA